MEKAPIIVCVTGAAGQIGYALSPLIGSGDMFGVDQPVELRLMDIEPMMSSLKGLAMELQDCSYTTLKKVDIGHDPKVMFKDVDVVIFLGGFPRKPGMERKELLGMNGKIFKAQGEALNEVGKATTKCLVVANPANTNCHILASYAKKIPKKNFSCLTRLDHNRLIAQLAEKASVKMADVKNVIVWGNHSSTQYPDVTHGTIGDKPITEVIKDTAYLRGPLISVVQKRGAAIMDARKFSSALSAAKAVKDHIRSWMQGTPEGQWVSMGIMSAGNKYGIDQDLCFSFPVKCKDFEWTIVDGLAWDEFSKEKIMATQKELIEERNDAAGALGGK